ncbi:hypothetical protein ACIGXI_00310 [Kitasatospora aureofaciens]|uniref:hypothetical protein n=1 Tax=Kitasatospora aureofaciens TaxID=1894 RepID=UPI0037CC2668
MRITSERDTSDSYALGTRAEPMSLPAQMLRAFLPPRTVRTDRVVSTAVLQPRLRPCWADPPGCRSVTTVGRSVMPTLVEW